MRNATKRALDGLDMFLDLHGVEMFVNDEGHIRLDVYEDPHPEAEPSERVFFDRPSLTKDSLREFRDDHRDRDA